MIPRVEEALRRPLPPVAARRWLDRASRLLWTAQRACTVSNSFIPAAVNWYEDLYGSEYADSVRELLTPDRTRAEVDAIVAATGAAPGMRFLDMGCGSGRQLIELGRRGYSGVGIEIGRASCRERV